MAKTWAHAELGTFQYEDDEEAWVSSRDIPTFAAFFSYSGPPYRLVIPDDYDNPRAKPPSQGAATVLSAVVKQAAVLVPKVAAALWDDFNGRGPNSGMWWHGGLDQIIENVGEGSPPARAGDLLALLGLNALYVREFDGRWMVELAFDAPFEDEHGIGVLTDGERILGTGYSVDARPFELA